MRPIWLFLRTRKRVWLPPLLFVAALLVFVAILGQGSAISAFTYRLF